MKDADQQVGVTDLRKPKNQESRRLYHTVSSSMLQEIGSEDSNDVERNCSIDNSDCLPFNKSIARKGESGEQNHQERDDQSSDEEDLD